jgi:hypothetical protein
VQTSNALDRECAHDIFSAFMLGLAGRIRSLERKDGTGSIPRASTHGMRNQERSRLFGSNTLIDDLAVAVKALGLASDIEEAYILIVPSLAAHDLLPQLPNGDLKEEKDWETRYPANSSSKRASSRDPFGERIYNGFNLFHCEEVIRGWLKLLFNDVRSEEVLDFLFEPVDRQQAIRK